MIKRIKLDGIDYWQLTCDGCKQKLAVTHKRYACVMTVYHWSADIRTGKALCQRCAGQKK